jgi:hypothetical protein
MSRPPSRRLRATWSMTWAISGIAFLTAAATLASSWLMMRAISRADLVSKALRSLVLALGGQLLKQGGLVFFGVACPGAGRS